jgi:hypothetical protein
MARLRRPEPQAAGQDAVMPPRLAAFHLGDYGLAWAGTIDISAYQQARAAWRAERVTWAAGRGLLIWPDRGMTCLDFRAELARRGQTWRPPPDTRRHEGTSDGCERCGRRAATGPATVRL